MAYSNHSEEIKFSVVIPLYNKEKNIAETLESVLNQSYPAFEIIVVDDGSTDNGAKIVEKFSSVRLIRKQNAGVSSARNTGITEAKGNFIAFIDADDLWLPHFLEEIKTTIEKFPAAGMYATAYQLGFENGEFKNPKIRFRRIDNSPRYLNNYFAIGSRGDLPFTMSSVVIRSRTLDSVGGFPIGEPMGEDQDLFCRVALRSGIAYSPRVLSIYQLGASNRACIRNIPKEECPFSKRLRQMANDVGESHLQGRMLDYCAAHVLSLAKLNIQAGRLENAKRLLDDEISDRLPVKKAWWSMRCTLGSIMNKSGMQVIGH